MATLTKTPAATEVQESAKFSWVATDRENKTKRGSITAANEFDVYRELTRRGLAPTKIAPAGALSGDVEILKRTKPKPKAMALAFRTMASVTTANIPIDVALEETIKQTEDKVLGDALREVYRRLKHDGISVSTTMREYPFFTSDMTSLIEAGEDSGNLPEALTRMANTLKAGVVLRSKVRAAMVYPAVVLFIAIAAMVGMLTFIVPIFSKMYDDLGSELPAPTQMLVAVSNSMVVVLPILIVAAIAGSTWYAKNGQREEVRRKVEPFKLKVPLLGPIFRKIALDRMASSLATLTASGIALPRALEIAGESSGNVVVRDAANEVAEGVNAGKGFADQLALHEDVFPSLMVSLVSTGEKTATLSKMLDETADFYHQEVEDAVEGLRSVIEPISIVIVGVPIALMVVAMYMPYFNLADAIK